MNTSSHPSNHPHMDNGVQNNNNHHPSTAIVSSSSSSSTSSNHNHVGLNPDTLNAIVDRLTQGILPNEVKFRPIPGGRQCAYLSSDDIM